MPVPHDAQQRILAEYSNKRPAFHDFARTLAGLIENLVRSTGVQLHSVSFRAKTAESLSEKLARPEKSYTGLSGITDLAGVRITTYFSEDVDSVARMLRTELFIDEQTSIDKRISSDPTRFGYKSLHYVVSLASDRAKLTEYAAFANLKCEIQLRSILQHAWAEIEHDLGYKSAAGVPAELRRRFSRIASLLELADDEFCAIRTELAAYERLVPERIRTAPETVSLDLVSFQALYSVPSGLTALDYAVVDATSGTLNASKINKPDVLVSRLSFFGITTIQQLERIAVEERSNVSEFARYWVPDKTLGAVSAGIGVFYLLYVLAWRTNDRTKIAEYLESSSIGSPSERDEIADRILAFTPSAGAT